MIAGRGIGAGRADARGAMPGRLPRCCSLLMLGLCLGGCRDDSERTDICSRALETLLDAGPSDFAVCPRRRSRRLSWR
jgi:hypothetical protein